MPQADPQRAESGVGDDLAARAIFRDLFSAIGGVFQPGGFLAHLAGADQHLLGPLGHLAGGILTRDGGLLAGDSRLLAGDCGISAGLLRLCAGDDRLLAGDVGLLASNGGLGPGAVDLGALLGRGLPIGNDAGGGGSCVTCRAASGVANSDRAATVAVTVRGRAWGAWSVIRQSILFLRERASPAMAVELQGRAVLAAGWLASRTRAWA